MELVVGRIGRAHGVRGDVSVDVRTDDPERRFAPGSVLTTEPGRQPVTVARARWHHGRLLVGFEDCTDRSTAELMRGQLLVIDAASVSPPTEPDVYWDHQLIGLTAALLSGEPIGVVDDVVHLPGSELLVVRRADGGEVLVPFVSAIVPTVDLDAGRLVVDPPDGLLEVNDPAAAES
jgi:16S rRNA processing protein RimM